MQARKRRALAFVWTVWCAGASVALIASCATSNDSPGNAGTAGTGGSSAAGTTGAAGATAGSGGGTSGSTAGTLGGGGSSGTGGATSGTAGTAGTAGTGGYAGSSNSGGTSGTSGGGRGGASAGGTGGTATGGSSAAGTTGGGGTAGKDPPEPSAGCGKANPSTGSSSNPLTVSGHMYYVKLPTGYDASKPYPTIIMFNPTGNPITWAEQNAGFEKNGAKDAAIRVYPHPANSSNGWGSGDVAFFMPLYTKLIGDYCIDKARVFAAGESSGGDFSSILGCEHADKLRAVAPCATKDVGGYPLDTTKRTCTGQVTAVVIHGKNDNVVGPANGPKTRDFYTKLNHCGTTTLPVPNYTDAMSNCLQYQGCDEPYPVYWCQHTDPEYSGTNHGWPKFAGNMLWMLFSSY